MMVFNHPPRTQSSQAKSREAGFSLVEVMMQLVILSIVTIPMLMLMQLQKHNLQESRQSLMNRMIADQLFDNQFLADSGLSTAFLLINPNGDGINILRSVHCDPMAHDKTPDELAKTCSTTAGYNRDTWKGPYFQRITTSVGSNARTMQTTIRLYRQQTFDTNNPPQPYYQSSRIYNKDEINWDFGSSYFGSITWQQYGQWMNIDQEGVLWEPVEWGVAVPAMTSTGFPAPYRRFYSITVNPGQNANLSLRGNVDPNTVYIVKVYGLSPDTIANNCFNNTSQLSCSVGTLLVYTDPAANFPTDTAGLPVLTNSSLVASQRMIDVQALGNIDEPGFKPILLTIRFRTPANARSIYFAVAANNPNTNSNVVRVSGLSIYRPKVQ